jgi:hypothetical protein
MDAAEAAEAARQFEIAARECPIAGDYILRMQ